MRKSGAFLRLCSPFLVAETPGDEKIWVRFNESHLYVGHPRTEGSCEKGVGKGCERKEVVYMGSSRKGLTMYQFWPISLPKISTF